MKRIRLMKQTILIIVGLLLSLNAYAAVNRIVAVVNDQVITQAQLQKQLAITRDRLKHRASNRRQPPNIVLKRQTLNHLINRKLQAQKAHELGIKVSSQELAKALIKMANHKNKSISQLYQAAREDGYSKQDFQKEVHDEILAQKVQGAILGPKIQVTPQDVQDYIDSHQQQLRQMIQYYVKDYWIKLPDHVSKQKQQQVKNKANRIYKQLKNQQIKPANLPDEVQVNDMGWQKLGQLPTPFVPALVDMQANQFAKPIKTSNGFHILYLKGKKSPHHQDVEQQIKQQAKQALFQQKLQEELVNWLAKLRSKAYIKIMPDSLKPILNN